MRALSKILAFTLAAVLCLALAAPALADITKVRDLGDGSVEVRWDDDEVYELVLVPKTGDDYQADLATYGMLTFNLEGKGKAVMYCFAPGQSYWVLTDSSTAPYAYKAARAGNFTEWRTPPKISVFTLREMSNGSYTDIGYLPGSDMEKQSNTVSYGVKWRLDYPQLKKPRGFLWQIVITTPDDIRYVYIADAGLKLPTGQSWVYDDFRELDTFFNAIMDMREEIPIGTYTFSIYWDGLHACSTDFKVR